MFSSYVSLINFFFKFTTYVVDDVDDVDDVKPKLMLYDFLEKRKIPRHPVHVVQRKPTYPT